MIKRTLSFGLCCLFFLSACQSYLSRVTEQEQVRNLNPVYAMMHVNVIPVQPAGVWFDQTLIVNQGRIIEIGAADQVTIPPNAQRLDLRGNYVLPGFSDMHVHISHERDLLLFLRYGITRVRNMAEHSLIGKWAGFPDLIRMRQQLQTQELLGPHMTNCGPFLDGDPPQNKLTTVIREPEQGVAAVQATVAEGFDCIKIYNQLSAKHFEAIAAEAKVQQIPIMGHVPHAVGLDGAIAGGMRSVEHLNAYVQNFKGEYRIPPAQWPAAIAKTRAADLYNCPTLNVWDTHPRSEDFSLIANQEPYRYVTPALGLFWRLALPGYLELEYPDLQTYPDRLLALSGPLVKALAEGGAPLLIGTDANLMGVYPGISALREMELFTEVGVSPAQTLEAATLNAARFVGQEKDSGSIATGKEADLVVLRANPLQDIRAVRETVGVMTQGRWLTSEQLDQWLEDSLSF